MTHKAEDRVVVYYDWKTSHDPGVIVAPDPGEKTSGYLKVHLDRGGPPIWVHPKHLEPGL